MTIASKSVVSRLSPLCSILIKSAPIAFIFAWNSQHTTPSPRSIRLAPELRSTSRPASFSDLRSRRSEEHTSELQSPDHLVCRLLLEKKKPDYTKFQTRPHASPPYSLSA